MTRRSRITGIAVAVCALVLVTSVAAELSMVGPQITEEPERSLSVGDIDGLTAVDTPGNATTVPEEQRLDRASLPERTPDNGTYQSIVIFRNDDIQAGYRPDRMRAVDNVFINESVPVTNAVIPRMAGENISDTETCSYLIELKRTHPKLIEYSLHGYTHESVTDFHGGSEFGGVPIDEQAARIARGKAILEACTGLTPRTFVPPFNTYDANTTAVLRANGIETISDGGWFSKEYYNRTDAAPFVARGTTHLPSSQSFIRNWSTDEFYSQQYLREQFDRSYRNHSVYVQMLHYPSFDTPAKRAQLRSLIRYMKHKPGVKFMTVDEFARGVREGTITHTPDGWRYSNATTEATANASGSSPLANTSRAPVETVASNETTVRTVARTPSQSVGRRTDG
ncbi:DUF2334 domain-containing protein [Halococcus sp. IIIV-5B]|uniref:DUF2334 domain-containing protein n=1 Tax=Halococcus sp. IIIV-5B TaxID=2321230 RepID=UPI000E7704F2|nr:DUF2334 domain-containing protein [Halococcus sp. IIIV-5B]RJT07967.1 DUF2334 domain-containing protein [Halococcus sp. IIIV-5B]